MKIVLALFVFLNLSMAHAEDKIKMYFKNEDITKIIEFYSKASGQKFVYSPNVRGLASILLQEPVSIDEAYNQLSSALALNGYAISKQGDTLVIDTARNIQRSLIEVSSELPALKPERLIVWVYKPQHAKVEDINRNLRMLASKDGEIMFTANTNQIYFTDWSSNIQRIAQLVKQADIEPTVMVTKNTTPENKSKNLNKKSAPRFTEDTKE